MTGDIQPRNKAAYPEQGCVMTLDCADNSPLVRGQEVVITTAGLIEARNTDTSDNFIGVVDSLPKNGKVGVRTIFLCETFVSSSDGTTSLGANGIGVKPTGSLLNGTPIYEAATSGNHYAAIILDNTDSANTRLGILYTPRISTAV
ncbi:hypothetical protein WAF17_16330 [Bernardetia sp. ABR2-2B]|uniref:hypothetical protein n=1 Tax=Bernardetia sp. ABR2-2B TaxID=3127472 RepID=UPI0030D4BBFA